MAFSLETKHEIIYLLGYPAKSIIEGSTHYNSIVADRLEDIDSFTQDNVESVLKEISSVRNKLTGLQDQGKLKQVGDIVFNVDNNDRTVKMEYKRLLKELSRYLDLPMKTGNSMIGVCL
jgi:hypothetical protein